MNRNPSLHLADGTLEKWRELNASDRQAALSSYFEWILPAIVEYLPSLDCHQHLRGTHYGTLVSLMGFSPETTVIAATLLRPQQLVIVRSKGTAESYDLATDFLVQRKFFRNSQLAQVEVDPTDPVSIYDKIVQYLPRADGQHHLIDVTGGKKVMSASAAIAASELDVPMCYIDGDYDAQMRRPTPGTERLIVLPSAGQAFARQRRERALDRYEAHDYPAAGAAWQASRQAQVHSSHLEDFAIALCHVYSAWTDLAREALVEKLDELQRVLEWPNARQLRRSADLEGHLEALRSVGRGEEVAMLATYFELAQRYATRGRYDFACLLIYRSMESVLQLGMQRATGGRFVPDAPDYSVLGEPELVEKRFVELAASIGNKGARLPYRVAMLDGLLLLGIMDEELVRRIGTQRQFTHLASWLKKEAEKRNRSVLAHGSKNLGAGDFRSMLELADKLAREVLFADYAQLQQLRAQLAPCSLRAVFRG